LECGCCDEVSAVSGIASVWSSHRPNLGG
jgi:hypothetical protein